MDVFETPASTDTTVCDREEGTPLQSGERNESSDLNSQERSGQDVPTMHRKGSNLVLGT